MCIRRTISGGFCTAVLYVMDMKHGNEFEGEETEPLLTRPRWPHSARESRFGPSLRKERKAVRRRGHQILSVREDEDEEDGPRRSFCRSWCEMWFWVARSKISCVVFTVILWIFGVTLILLTVFSGLESCPSLLGTSVFCYLLSSLALALSILCCCYHWVRDDEDLPHAIFCMAYCLLLLFIFTSVAGTTSVFTHYDSISNGTVFDWESKKVLDCGMTYLPYGIMILSFFLGAFFLVMSYVACILALGATSDIKW